MPCARRTAVTTLALSLAVTGLAPGAAEAGRRHGQPDPGLGAAIDQILAEPQAQTAAIGLSLKDGQTGERLYAHADQASLIPASNSKLRTSAAAMDVLGPDYHFKTDLLTAGTISRGTLSGGLTIKGYGDPTLIEADLDSLASQLKSAGVRTVNGPLTVDTSFFDDVRYHPGWDPADETDYYAGQISALTLSADSDLDNGTFVLEYTPGANPGDPVTLSTTPSVAGQYLSFDNQLRTTPAGTENTVRIVRQHGTNHVVLTGNVPADDGSTTEWITVDDPGLYAAAAFRAALGRVGILVTGPTVKGTAPNRARRLARDTSVSLGEILVPWLKLSNNPISEDVLKTMAAEQTRRPGTWAAGTRIVEQWQRRNHIPTKGTVVADGSGLARANRLTADSTTELLRRVQTKDWFQTWYNAMPVAGDSVRLVGGTLRSRMKGTPAADNLHGKTGTLTGVTSLSGYVTGADGRPYVFSMLSNYSGATTRPLEDRLGVLLAGWSRPGGWTPAVTDQRGHGKGHGKGRSHLVAVSG